MLQKYNLSTPITLKPYFSPNASIGKNRKLLTANSNSSPYRQKKNISFPTIPRKSASPAQSATAEILFPSRSSASGLVYKPAPISVRVYQSYLGAAAAAPEKWALCENREVIYAIGIVISFSPPPVHFRLAHQSPPGVRRPTRAAADSPGFARTFSAAGCLGSLLSRFFSLSRSVFRRLVLAWFFSFDGHERCEKSKNYRGGCE